MFGLVIAAAAAAFCLSALVRRPLFSVVMLLGLSLVYLIIARIVYDRAGVFLVTVPVLTAFLLSGLITSSLDYAIERMEKLRTRRTLDVMFRRISSKRFSRIPAASTRACAARVSR